METPPPVYTAVPPRTSPSGNDKIWSILSHLSLFLGMGIILPLVVYLSMKRDSAYTAENAREALNFHLSLYIYAACCVPLIFLLIGIPILIIMGVCSVVFAIVAAIKASEDGCYHYPLTLPLIR